MLIKFDFMTWGDENGAATTDMEAFFSRPWPKSKFWQIHRAIFHNIFKYNKQHDTSASQDVSNSNNIGR